jgi:hypothetical protein
VRTRIDSPWKKTSEAIALLGVSDDWLLSMRHHWKAGQLWRNIQRPNAMRPTYQWHVGHIEEWLKLDAAKRG